jgi:hypothetical protein
MIHVDASTLLLLLMAAGIALGLLLLARRPVTGVSHEALRAALAPLAAELARATRQAEALRAETQRGREAWLTELGATASSIRGDINDARRTLAEVRAREEVRSQQMAVAAESLRRLEAVLAGAPTRGAAGENLLERALAQLPPDIRGVNVAFGGRVVEYALRLPGGRWLPIDSKWTSVGTLDRLSQTDDPAERRRLSEAVARELRGRVRDMSKYLDPERTLSLGVVAVPDAVHAATAEVHGEGYRDGVLIVPYSLAMPLLLTVYRLAARLGAAGSTLAAATILRDLAESLTRLDEEIEGRLSRALVQAGNSRDALRNELGAARRGVARLVDEGEGRLFEEGVPAATPVV